MLRLRALRHLAPTTRRPRPMLERLDERCLPAVTLPTPRTPGPAVLTGTAGDDRFLVRLQAGAAANVQFSADGGASFQTAALTNVTAVQVQGVAGRDTLTIDQT